MRKILCACFIIGFAGYLAGYATCDAMWKESLNRVRQRRESKDSYSNWVRSMEEKSDARP